MVVRGRNELSKRVGVVMAVEAFGNWSKSSKESSRSLWGIMQMWNILKNVGSQHFVLLRGKKLNSKLLFLNL